jgi:hypothetical protein
MTNEERSGRFQDGASSELESVGSHVFAVRVNAVRV